MKKLLLIAIVALTLGSCQKEPTLLEKMQGTWLPDETECLCNQFCVFDRITIEGNAYIDKIGTSIQTRFFYNEGNTFYYQGSDNFFFEVIEVNSNHMILDYKSPNCDSYPKYNKFNN